MLPTRLQGLSASRRLIRFFSSLIVFKESRFLRTCTQYARVRFRRKKKDAISGYFLNRINDVFCNEDSVIILTRN